MSRSLAEARNEALEKVRVLSNPNDQPLEAGGHAHITRQRNAAIGLVLGKVESGVIVTSERAALLAMAERSCLQATGRQAECSMYFTGANEYCAPCFSRHVLLADCRATP